MHELKLTQFGVQNTVFRNEFTLDVLFAFIVGSNWYEWENDEKTKKTRSLSLILHILCGCRIVLPLLWVIVILWMVMLCWWWVLLVVLKNLLPQHFILLLLMHFISFNEFITCFHKFWTKDFCFIWNLMRGSSHIQSLSIDIEYRNWHPTLNTYLLVAISIGIIEWKPIYKLTYRPVCIVS